MKEKLIATLKAFPVVTAVTIGICYLTTLLADVLFGVHLDDQESLEQVRSMIVALVKRICGGAGYHWFFFRDILSLLYIILLLTVLTPVVEEVIFRWALWRLPKPELPLVSAITSSALFSAAHYIQMPWPNNAFMALFFFGMAQCWLYRKTDSLWCPMLNHGLFNAVNLVLLFVFK